MKKSVAVFLSLVVLAVTAKALIQAPPAGQGNVTDLVPAGPLLLLEARSFSSLLRDWNGSQEKRLWLESENFKVFEQSRLYLRLAEAYDEFSHAAGFSPDMQMLEQIAGEESLLALYDIGKLEFLYVTRLPAASVTQSLLWQTREIYQPRNAAGLPYFVHLHPETRRVVGFAAHSDYLLIATREDLLAGALTLLAGRGGNSVKGERWYEQSVRASGTPGHLRLVMNLEALVRSPHFRSYWIQRNVQQLRQYQGGVCDAHLTASEIREERVLLRPQAALGDPTPAGGRGVAELLRLVPDTAGLYRIWDSPSADRVADILETKILSPRPRLFLPGKTAPGVHLSDEPVGTEADLETRIDEAPPPRAHSALDPKALQALLGAMKLEGMLHFQSSKLAQRDVLVANESAVAILALSDWNAEAARGALLQSIESLWTVSRLGTQWVQRQRGAYGYYELDGLARLAVATQGRLLIVADGPDPLLSVLERASIPPGSSFAAIYAAGFRHSLERDNFARMMRLMDYPSIRLSGTGGAADGREPQFFSENIASLSRVLARVETASIIVRDNGSSLAQTLIYRLRR